jgi:dCTP deaminase
MSALSGEAIRAAMHVSDLDRRLVITPLLEREDQIQDASVDMRLGTEFLVPTRSDVSLLDPHRDEHAAEVAKIFRPFHVALGKTFVLHPKQFVLGCTLEYVRFPSSLMGYLEGRSSWGRHGLQIATATVVSPSFAGVLTFEITNVGEVPMHLRAGTRIAQFVIHTVEGANRVSPRKRRSQFRIPTGPEIAKFEADPDRRLLQAYLDLDKPEPADAGDGRVRGEAADDENLSAD